MLFTSNTFQKLCVSIVLFSVTSLTLADAIITSTTQSYIEYERRDMNGFRKISREPVNHINLGDEVLFVNLISNSGDMAAYNFSITSEIPEGSQLLEKDVTLNDNVAVSISTSGNTWFPWKLASGNLMSARYISWTVNKLNAGEELELAFKIRVKGTEAPVSTATNTAPTPTITPSTKTEISPTALPTTSSTTANHLDSANNLPQRTPAPLSEEVKNTLEQQLNDNVKRDE